MKPNGGGPRWAWSDPGFAASLARARVVRLALGLLLRRNCQKKKKEKPSWRVDSLSYQKFGCRGRMPGSL